MPLIVKGARQIGKTDGYEVNNVNPKFIFPKISKNFFKKTIAYKITKWYNYRVRKMSKKEDKKWRN